MTRSLKLLACALYVVFATTACYPNKRVYEETEPHETNKNVTLIAVSNVPNTPYKLMEYEVIYDTNRVVRCISLKHTSFNTRFAQNSLSCDWERSR